MNKQIFLLVSVVAALFFFSCNSSQKLHYETSEYKGHKMLKGIINRQLLVNDTAFAWFTENKKLGHPDAEAVKTFNERKKEFKMIVFGGTWCEDTQNLLPQFYNLVDASQYPEKNIELIAVNKQKETINNLHKKYKIENVPTFIVLKNDKEIARVVEYGKEGDITKELGEIVKGIK